VFAITIKTIREYAQSGRPRVCPPRVREFPRCAGRRGRGEPRRRGRGPGRLPHPTPGV